MQFNRSALVAAIDEAIKQERATIDAVRESNRLAAEAQREEWLSLNHDNWMKATAAIRAKLRKGQPVVEEDIPRDRASSYGKAFFRAKSGTQVVAVTTELVGLRSVLSAVSDDEISTAALRSLGVGVQTLRKIVPLLGAATVRGEVR